MSKIFVLVDALRNDYINKKNTPFLYHLSQNNLYINRIKPSLGFCERSEIISGYNSEQTGYFTAIGKDIKKSDYKDLPKGISKLLEIINIFFNKIPTFKFLGKKINFSKLFKRILNRILKKKYSSKMSIYNIPINQLNNFYLTEDEYDHFSDNFINKDNLIMKIKRKGMDINNEAWTYLGKSNQMSDDETMNFLISKNIESSNEFIFAYLGTLDAVGHKYGPKSKKMVESLSYIDSFFEKLISLNDNNDIIILGDHGMKTINKFLNVSDEIHEIQQKFNLKINHNFNFFIDSTMLRLWVNNDQKIDMINFINSNNTLSKYGKIIHQKHSSKVYGNVVWLANEGVMLYPDFFHFKKPVGMHGYDNELKNSQGTAIIYKKDLSNSYIKSLNLCDLNNLIMETLF